MEFVWTIVLAAAAFFGLSELATIFGAWWNGEGALEAAATAVEAEFPEAAALIASTTEALLPLASSSVGAQ